MALLDHKINNSICKWNILTCTVMKSIISRSTICTFSANYIRFTCTKTIWITFNWRRSLSIASTSWKFKIIIWNIVTISILYKVTFTIRKFKIFWFASSAFIINNVCVTCAFTSRITFCWVGSLGMTFTS